MSKNTLAQTTSPYLLQHKDNPVHWHSWGDEAFAQARDKDCPILLSIGYAACHWCHVMAHESFENPEIAALMNEHFVNVKVDREEHPDIDAIYMAALHTLGEQGGWPLTMFLTPDAKPFWGGTYFPPEPRWGRPSFPAVLTEISRLYHSDRAAIENNTAAITSRLASLSMPAPGDAPTPEELTHIARQLLSAMDMDLGGLRGAPKFPNCAVFDLLLRIGLNLADDTMTAAAVFALERICEGGIYDHLGGGFARYAVDERWLVPHFEKMLYDNAQLLDTLTLAWQITRKPLFAARIAETVTWLSRDMRLPGGGFASSLDADSEGVEGRYYVWSHDEVSHLLDPSHMRLFAETYDVTRTGNWEGSTILNRLSAPPFTPETDAVLAPMRERLLSARNNRVPPGLDDKVLADWNGLAIDALARAGAALCRPDWIVLARDAFRFVCESMSKGPALFHSWRDGMANIEALATDYANMSAAALTLHEVTGDPTDLDHARAWLDVLQSQFAAPTGGYFLSRETTSNLIVKNLSATDDATPNHNATIASALVRLSLITGDDNPLNQAHKTITAFSGAAKDRPFSHLRLLAAAHTARQEMEIIVAGPTAQDCDLRTISWQAPAPGAIRLSLPDATNHTSVANGPSHNALDPKDRDTTAFVCARRVCSPPVASAPDLKTAIRLAMRG